MVENIKQIIAEASRELFNANGYQKVTMRRIADRCGISVGNLTYHYPHKEDLLMLEHDGILNAFLEDVTNKVPYEYIRASGRDALATLEYTFAAIKSYENGGALVVPEALPPMHGDISLVY